MQIWRRIIDYFDNSSDSREFRRAQYVELTRQIPLMYGIVIINMVLLASAYVGKVPHAISIVIPAVIVAVCAGRAVRTVLRRRDIPSDAVVASNLRTTTILACIMGVLISVWSMLLFNHGDAYSKAQNTFFTGITIITVMTCLRSLRSVAPALFVLVVIPTVIFLALQDHHVFKAIALNMLLVIGGMVVVMQRSSSDFRQRIDKQVEVDAQRSQLETLNEAVSLLANEDSLTRLANRRMFFEHLDERIVASGEGRADQRFAVGVLDLDGFKPVNDVFGHAVGDRLLQEVAVRLSKNLPQDTLVARLGGDEFALILPRHDGEESLRKICREALDALEPPFVFNKGSVTVSATCGIACFPGVATTGQELYEKADFALFYSKQHDRGSVTIFSDVHEAEIRKAAKVAQRLRAVQFDEAFHLEYQPIVDGNGNPMGFEALARWHDPVLGQVPPDVFIRAAEQSGMIGQITTALFRQALQAARAWPDELFLSFNLSVHDVCSDKTIAALLSTIDAARFPTRRLTFEITESAIMQDFSRAVTSLDTLRLKGASVSLDDFGTGYSSLSYLRHLPIDRVKVDRSFILDIDCDTRARDIMRSIASMCQSLGLQCIVEGVETREQLDILRNADCNGYQGYLFSRPLRTEAIPAYLAEQAGLRRSG